MQNLPFSNADSGMSALMALVTIVPAKEVYLSLLVNGDFVNRKKSKTGT